jgi:Family of unknown function (DUF5372)
MVRVTHPFHPWFGQELEFVKRLRTWRADRVFFFDGRRVGVVACGVDRSRPT